MQAKLWKVLAAPALGALLLTGCAADDEGLLLPDAAPAGSDLFARYVALGQSNTAGYMSAGINDSTQAQSYAVLLARQAGGPFFVPELRMPGCPPPLLGPQPLTSARVGDGTPTTCALRDEPFPPFVSNLAVPGSRIVDWVDNNLTPSASNPLTTLLLGGRTQVQALRDANPTFVTAFPEGNEVLTAALAGVPALALPQAAFEAALDQVVAAIREEGAQAALFGVVDVPAVSPALLPGAYYFALQAAGRSPKPVAPTCAPGTTGGASLVAFSILSNPEVTTITCAENQTGVLSPTETADLRARIRAYNNAVQQRAQANDWLYVNTEAITAQALQNPQQIRKCQALFTLPLTATPTQFAQAVSTTCPGPTAPNFWGSFFSFDPVHFNPEGHRFIANALIPAINQKYGTTIPTL